MAVELLAACALAVLWMADRERSYTLWWGLSHAMLPIPSILITFANAQNNPSQAVVLGLCFANATQAVGLMAGVIDYRSYRFELRSRHVLLAILAVAAGFYLLTALQDNVATRLAMVGAMAVALLASAALMWSLGIFERIAAICFAARGVLELARVYLTITGEHQSFWFTHFLGFSAFIAIATILALLIAAYQRSLRRLEAQYRRRKSPRSYRACPTGPAWRSACCR